MFKEILTSFLPWILYFVIVGHTQERLDLAIVVAAVSSCCFDFKGIKKGFILSWGTLLFFIFLFVTVIVMRNAWIAKHEWLLSNGTLALIAWGSMVVKRPFTIQYAKEFVPADKWDNPLFIKINYILTAVWGFAFLIGLGLNVLPLYFSDINDSLFEISTYLPSIVAIVFTNWFPDWYKAHYFKKLSAQKSKASSMKDNPYLKGNFAPIHQELDKENLEIIGAIPQDLTGIYMRNGPNPEFTPISYTYPFDGDGMIHAVYIADGKANYRNRYVETKGLLKERKAGKALYGGVLDLIPMDPKWAGPEDDPIAVKNGAFIHIIRHANRYLALWEGGSAYEMTKELKTLGEWQPEGAQAPIPVCAHTRLDPRNGDLWFVNYSAEIPYLTFNQINNRGVLVKKYDIAKDYATMVHDFVLTENYVIVFDCPIVFDMNEITRGGDVFSWKPELGVKMGVMAKKDGSIKWFHTEAFFVFHFANAYEDQQKIIIDFVHHLHLNLKSVESSKPRLHRAVLDLRSGIVTVTALDDRIVEFPRLRENINSLTHQFIYTPTRTSGNRNAKTFNALVKYDVKNQTSQVHEFGDYMEIGEAVFAPSASSQAEDDGYLLLFAYDSQTGASELQILPSQDFLSAPIARVKMPQRIPHGLHGSWMGW